MHNIKEERIINIVWANVVGILIIIPIIIVLGIPYYLLWKEQFTAHSLENLKSDTTPLLPLIILASMIIGIVLHELIHGFFFSLYAKNGFKAIKFGIIIKMLTPYCHCKEPLKRNEYIIGALAPGIILGFIPGIIAIIIGSPFLLIWGFSFTMAASGDFLVVGLLRKEKRSHYVLDHPSKVGYILLKHE